MTQQHNQNPKLLSERDVETTYGIERRTLQAWRLRGQGPVFLKVGRMVRYRVEDIEAFLDAARRTSTSDDGRVLAASQAGRQSTTDKEAYHE